MNRNLPGLGLKLLVLTHVAFEGPARIASLASQLGYYVEVRALHLGQPVPWELGADEVLVVMGGPMGVGDMGRPEYGFLEQEVALLRRCLRRGAPVLGVCLGAQLLALAGGAKVFPMPGESPEFSLREVGWAPITFVAEKGDPILSGVERELAVFHWHGDTFELPEGAQRLASSPICLNQAFRIGARAIGLQFHCELGSAEIETLLAVDTEFAQKARGLHAVEEVRSETWRHYTPAFELQRDRLLHNILLALGRR